MFSRPRHRSRDHHPTPSIATCAPRSQIYKKSRETVKIPTLVENKSSLKTKVKDNLNHDVDMIYSDDYETAVDMAEAESILKVDPELKTSATARMTAESAKQNSVKAIYHKSRDEEASDITRKELKSLSDRLKGRRKKTVGRYFTYYLRSIVGGVLNGPRLAKAVVYINSLSNQNLKPESEHNHGFERTCGKKSSKSSNLNSDSPLKGVKAKEKSSASKDSTPSEEETDSDDENDSSDGDIGKGGRKRYEKTRARTLITEWEDFGAMKLQEVLSAADYEHFKALLHGTIYRFDKLLSPRRTPPRGIVKFPGDAKELFERIRGPAELMQPWMPTKDTKILGGILIRLWDSASQSQIQNKSTGFLSGAGNTRLNTWHERKMHLEQHADFGNRKPTPFISVSSSVHDIADKRISLFQKRQRKSRAPEVSSIKITIMNANARIAAEWPILSMLEVLQVYKCEDALRSFGPNFFEHEYLLPFRVGPKEIVGTWYWTEVERWMRERNADIVQWYMEVAVLAYEEHEKARVEGREVVGGGDF